MKSDQKNEIKFTEFAFGSDKYQAMLPLRERVLRHPNGMTLSEENLRGEDFQRHFGLFDKDDQPIAGLILAPRDNNWFQIRQMAVETQFHRSGFGTYLISQTENLIFKDGIRNIFLKARLVVKEFYEKSNYHAVGEVFSEINMPHIRMEKILADLKNPEPLK
jgi:predicted GNAT family N-acyltransferase